MGRRGRKRSPFRLKLRLETIYSLGSLVFFALAGLITISFSGQGESLQAVNDVLRQSFGPASLLLPFVCITAGMVLTGAKWSFAKPQVLLGSFFFFLSWLVLGQSGQVGVTLFTNFADLIQPLGTRLVFGLLGIAGFMIFTDTSLRELIAWVLSIVEVDHSTKEDRAKDKVKINNDSRAEEQAAHDAPKKSGFSLRGFSLSGKLGKKEAAATTAATTAEPSPSFVVNEARPTAAAGANANALNATNTSAPAAAHNLTTDSPGPLANEPGPQVWEYPPLSLLSKKRGQPADRGDIKVNAQIIEDTFQSFGISAQVVEVNCGPAVTQYAIKIGTGTKLTKITSLANDLALALAAPTGQIRIEAPIPGRSLVGIEIPNKSLEVVTLRTMLSSEAMQKQKSKLSVSLGLNVAGEPIVADIAKMPHVLIAGATGSGKSVAVNAFIASILFRASPDEVKFIMVDPKRVELTQYNDIPHLLTPVITEPKKVVAALRWATAEMDKRYKLFAEVGVRNIAAFNEMSGFQAMPYILIVIDELADMMLFAPTEVEECVVRIAQMARAVGIHLVLATQRPSVDVLTGLIKANIPTRLAFNVSSNTDSRVIIDQPGAEKLLGRGDMLFVPPDEAKPRRIQGTFVSDEEMRELIQFLKNQHQQPQYEAEVVEKYESTATGGGTNPDDIDEFFDQAVEIVLADGKGSASLLQRRLSIGYNRAARILDQLSEQGLVGQSQGSKPREVNRTAVQQYLEKIRVRP